MTENLYPPDTPHQPQSIVLMPSPVLKLWLTNGTVIVSEAASADKDLLRKLPLVLSPFPDIAINIVGPPIAAPDDYFVPPAWLLQTIQQLVHTPVPTPRKPPIQFSTTPSALRHNTSLLKRHDFDFGSFLAENQDTTIGYNSEFRPIDQIRPLLGDHPHFPFLENMASTGMDYIYTSTLTEAQRTSELTRMLQRGNHKSARDNPDDTQALLAKDVLHGFSMPCTRDVVEKLPGAMVQPCGIARQFTLQEDGSRVRKNRLTHDLSFSATNEQLAVNARIDLDRYPAMVYGWCSSRVIHFIVALRAQHPTTKIFISKYDFSDAYKRVAHSAGAMVQTIIIIGEIAYVALRMTFGGAANPPAWCALSECITDLANEIACLPNWNPTTVCSPIPNTPTFHKLDAATPFAQSQPLAVTVPVTLTARHDCFIDDIIQVFLDTLSNRYRMPSIVPLAVHVTCRPHAGSAEPVKRRPLLSPSKLSAEGAPAEVQIVLGWELNTRTLTLALPHDKYTAWTHDIDLLINDKSVLRPDLESLLGRLNHASFVIPLARHFTNHLRRYLKITRNRRQRFTLTSTDVADLTLWKTFLASARTGISLNRITKRQPSKICISDSCPFGLGGFLLSGPAWRLQIPPSSPIYGESKLNNVLEFLAMAITIWLQLDNDPHPEHCILALGDNTSALGWLYRSGHVARSSLYYEPLNFIARTLASQVVQSNSCLASQHLRGDYNTVADWLSYNVQHRGSGSSPHPLAADNPPDDNFILCYASSGTRRIILDSKQENAHEKRDRVWRRWSAFCTSAGLGDNKYLHNIPPDGQELLVRAFLSMYRTTTWDRGGRPAGQRQIPVVGGTVRDAASQLAATFRDNLQRSPLHIEGSTKLLPSIRSLLRAFDNVDAPPHRQRAITPRFLSALFHSCRKTYPIDAMQNHTADLVIAAFFFAMRACEYTQTARPGKTKVCIAQHIIFRSKTRHLIAHDNPTLATTAFFVTVVFADQKNGRKLDARTQRRTGNPILCPVLRWASVITRLIRTLPSFNDCTPVCSHAFQSKPVLISSSFVRLLMRSVCAAHGGKQEFGFGPPDIGNKSLRSGAAMALFLANHSPAKIMILGRWVSDAFLVYIRPQVLEWTNTMSIDMINLESFLDAAFDMVSPDDPRTRTVTSKSFNGRDSVVTMPKFHLHH